MRYVLRADVDVDFMNQRRIAERLGIHEVTLCNILKRKKSTDKPTAVYITILNGGDEKDLDKYFELEKKGR